MALITRMYKHTAVAKVTRHPCCSQCVTPNAHTNTHTRTHARMHAHTHTHTHTYIHTHTNTKYSCPLQNHVHQPMHTNTPTFSYTKNPDTHMLLKKSMHINHKIYTHTNTHTSTSPHIQPCSFVPYVAAHIYGALNIA